jgi:hypothetical protein
MTHKYVVDFDNPPPPHKDMLYWERYVELSVSVGTKAVHEVIEQLAKSLAANEPISDTGGWKLYKEGAEVVCIKDGTEYNVTGPLDYARRQSAEGTLIAVPSPRTFRQAKAIGSCLGTLVRCEPQLDVLLEECRSGDALYVLMPSKLWPDFAESPLAAAVYDANTSFSTLVKGYLGEISGTPVWSEMYEAPCAQVLDGDLWIVRRDAEPERKECTVNALNPPEPIDYILYWERAEESGQQGWLSVDVDGDAMIFIADGCSFEYDGERAEYEITVEDSGVTIAIARPRTVQEAFRYSPIRGAKTLRPSVLKFFHECNTPNTHYIIIGSELWSKIIAQRKLFQDQKFLLSTDSERTLNGFLGQYNGTEIWTDAFLLSEDRFCNNKMIVCREVTNECVQ